MKIGKLAHIYLALGWRRVEPAGVAGLELLQESKQRGGLPDTTELDAERLDLGEQLLHIDDLVPNQGLQKHAYEPYQAVLHVTILDGLASGYAVADVEVYELRW